MQQQSGSIILQSLLLTLSVFTHSSTWCQSKIDKAFTQQVSITCDNNFLVFNGEDGYYTSGIFLQFDRVSKKTTENRKLVYTYEIGQQIYTAYSRKILPAPSSQFPGGIDQIDRPIAGYLYGKVSRNLFYYGRKMFSVGVSLGTIGENSFGRRVQESWHNVIGVKDYWNWVWDYQVKNEVGINVHGTYAQSLFNHEQRLSYFQATTVSQVMLGTTFVNATQGVLLQIGKLQKMGSSGFWNSRIELDKGSEKRQHELFLYYKPEIKYQLYNATIQGGLFRKDKGEITSTPSPVVFSQTIGVSFSLPRYTLSYQVVLVGKEANSQFNNQVYAGLIAAFRF